MLPGQCLRETNAHLPESKFEEMVIFSKRAVIFPAAQLVVVLEMAAGMQLSTLTLGLTGPPERSSAQGSSEAAMARRYSHHALDRTGQVNLFQFFLLCK